VDRRGRPQDSRGSKGSRKSMGGESDHGFGWRPSGGGRGGPGGLGEGEGGHGSDDDSDDSGYYPSP